MKKQTIIINIMVIVPLFTLIFNIGDLRCQEDSHRINAQYQSEYVERSTLDGNEDNLRDDKNIRLKILELLIKRNLLYRYQELDEKELEARLD